jgi:adenosylhomocysteine nucleosidase
VIALVCAMPMELKPLRRKLGLQKGEHGYVGRAGAHDVVGIATGMGTPLARAATERLLDAVEVDRVIVVGITGAIENETPIGTLVLPEVVVNSNTGSEHRPEPLPLLGPSRGVMWTTDELLLDPAIHADLRSKGVISLDMETAAVGEVCEARGVPWSVIRVISDRASDGSVDPEVFALSNQDGTPNPRAVARYFLRHPGKLPQMAKLAKGSKLATERAADAAIRVLTTAS